MATATATAGTDGAAPAGAAPTGAAPAGASSVPFVPFVPFVPIGIVASASSDVARRVESSAPSAALAPAPSAPSPSAPAPAPVLGHSLPEQSDWVIGLHEVSFHGKIGAGSAGTTYAATWNGARVAVKVAGCNPSSMESWRAEVDALTRLRHPNVVQYLGCVISPPTYCLVLDYCDAGDLYRALRLPTPPGFLLRVARNVAAGMAYLHRRQVMHRDLKSSNVLLDTAGGVKLTDFGVAVRVKDGRDSEMHGYAHGVQGAGLLWGDTDEFERSCDPLSGEMGTYRWMAPEVTRHEGYTKSADVFSYAMLLFELLTHEIPFADRPPLQAAVAIGLQDLRPPLPPDAPRALTDLVCECWKRRPTTRPKFDGVLTQLAQASAALTFDEIKWLDAPHGHPVYKPALQASNGSMPGAAPIPLLPAPGLHDTAVSGVVGVMSAVQAQVDLPLRAQETAPTAPAADANCKSALFGTRSRSMFPAQETAPTAPAAEAHGQNPFLGTRSRSMGAFASVSFTQETAPVHHETMIIEPSLSRQRSGPELKLSVGIPM